MNYAQKERCSERSAAPCFLYDIAKVKNISKKVLTLGKIYAILLLSRLYKMPCFVSLPIKSKRLLAQKPMVFFSSSCFCVIKDGWTSDSAFPHPVERVGNPVFHAFHRLCVKEASDTHVIASLVLLLGSWVSHGLPHGSCQVLGFRGARCLAPRRKAARPRSCVRHPAPLGPAWVLWGGLGFPRLQAGEREPPARGNRDNMPRV